jgi:DNA-binding transcriptional regulator LsrR (DeoR family)
MLQQAHDQGLVRTVVDPPPGLHSDLEEYLEARYELAECHVVETVGDTEPELAEELGRALASVLAAGTVLASPTGVVGYTSWSRTLQATVAALTAIRGGAGHIVEMLGDTGPPTQQHAASGSTQQLATLTDAQPVFQRVPGVCATAHTRTVILEQNQHARDTLHLLDRMDVALIGLGSGRVVAPLTAGENFFTAAEFHQARTQGAVGELCLRFLDAQGRPVPTPLDDRIIGVTLDQIRAPDCGAPPPPDSPSTRSSPRPSTVDGWIFSSWTPPPPSTSRATTHHPDLSLVDWAAEFHHAQEGPMTPVGFDIRRGNPGFRRGRRALPCRVAGCSGCCTRVVSTSGVGGG